MNLSDLEDFLNASIPSPSKKIEVVSFAGNYSHPRGLVMEDLRKYDARWQELDAAVAYDPRLTLDVNSKKRKLNMT